MANSSLGYSEPGSPNKRLFSRNLTEDTLTKDVQGVLVCDGSGNIVGVSSNRLQVDASGVAVPVTDNASSLTVDAPVGTPVFVRLSDGTTAIATLPVDTELPAAAALGDTVANPTTPLVGAPMLGFDPGPATWQRWRSNADVFGTASGARTTTLTSSTSSNHNWRGIQLCVNVTSAGTGSITPTIEGFNATASVWFALNAAPTPITANGHYVYEIYPGVGAASGGVTQRTSGIVPRYYRYVITANNANSITYSVAVNGIL